MRDSFWMHKAALVIHMLFTAVHIAIIYFANHK